MRPSRNTKRVRSDRLLAEQSIEQLIALLHTVGHAGRDGGVAGLLRPEVNQTGHGRHAGLLGERDRHDRLASRVSIANGPGIVRFRVDEPRGGLNFAERAGEAELAAILVALPTPAVAAADPHIHLAHRHRPSRWTQQPSLYQLRLRISLEHERSG